MVSLSEFMAKKGELLVDGSTCVMLLNVVHDVATSHLSAFEVFLL